MDAEIAENLPFDPTNVDLTTADPRDIICFLNDEGNEYDGRLGLRIAAIFVIFIISTACTVFPYIARRIPKLKIPTYVFLFARHFGAGVIVATAFIHLLQPAYEAIGPASCVGMTGGWAEYTWPPGIALASVIILFIIEVFAERYSEKLFSKEAEAKFGAGDRRREMYDRRATLGQEASTEQKNEETYAAYDSDDNDSIFQRYEYRSQFVAFLILEFGIIFHSVIIGLDLGVSGDEFNTLFPVLVFHQGFEGLGIGARLSAIPFKKGSYIPYILCLAYGLSTPLAIAIGLGVRETYNPGSFTANVVSGILDSISAGILVYTGLVELLAKDFLFDPKRTRETGKLVFMLTSVVLGAGIMALLGKWA